MLIKELLKISDIENHLKKILIEEVTGQKYYQTDQQQELTKCQLKRYQKYVNRLKKCKPIQYILGKTNFYGYEFYINKNVLIPRPETELLVEETIKYIKHDFKNPNILDLCTGSGCIGLTLKKEIDEINITLSDISKKALKVARINQERLNVNAKIVRSDLLKKINEKYDIVISNPPYVSYEERIDELVSNNEPKLALYAKEEGLYYYEKILESIEKNLNEKYLIALEIGEHQATSIEKIAKKYLTEINVVVKKDLNGRNRMIFITHNID